MPTPHPAIAELRAVLGERGVVSDPNELRVYECDGFPIAKGMPIAVVFPIDTEQVSAAVKILNKHNLAIVPRGSGTGLAGGCVSFGDGVLVSTSRMTKIEKIDITNRMAIVQAGVRNLALSDAVAASGFHFSPDPSSQRAATIGGNAATNAGGINTLKHGVTVNHILGVEMVLPDGTIIQTRAGQLFDGVGPDLPALLCGSEGTFGIITRLWCRLAPKPKHFRTVYAVFPSTADACKTVTDVIAAGILPTSMEMMDGAMIQVVEQAFHFGFPSDAAALLLLEIDGVDEVLDEQMEAMLVIAQKNNARDCKRCSDPARRAELWSARKKAFGAIGRISRSYCTQDACIPRSKLPEAMERINAIGKRHGLTITNVFHAGDGNVHPILLFDEDKPEEVQRTLIASQEILEYCIEIGGTITGEHGVGVEKLHLMPKLYSAATLQTFLSIKKTFDPRQIINDAKLIPSDKLFVELVHPVGMNMNVSGGAGA
ncbi:MAG: FAD-binding protein [Planctomycetota bacterium]|nr:FAD-binding protein [Planctomycetota bacterium]